MHGAECLANKTTEAGVKKKKRARLENLILQQEQLLRDSKAQDTLFDGITSDKVSTSYIIDDKNGKGDNSETQLREPSL